MALLPHQLQSLQPMAPNQLPHPPSPWLHGRIQVGGSQIYGPNACSGNQLQEASSPQVSVDQARDYVAAVQMRFIDYPDTYKYFIDALKLFRSGQMSAVEVVERVITLLRDQSDLLRAFISYLPASPNGILRERVMSAAMDAEQRTC
ncbi:hypothetical protein PINS_up020885 [Pythium insidiosum]|nr:hypothetical protein PINS_up020885 [Pythium insidiosum]